MDSAGESMAVYYFDAATGWGNKGVQQAGFGFGDNGFTGTEDAFDIYYPNGTYNGTWYFGGYPNWATWSGQIMGSGVAAHMSYYGIGAQSNHGHLYTSGSFSASGAGAHFMFALHGQSASGELAASLTPSSQYIPSMGITRLVGPIAPGFPTPMSYAFIGDFSTYDITPPAQYVGVTAYFQAVIRAGSNNYASNGIVGTIAP